MKMLLLLISLSALYQPMIYARTDYIYPGKFGRMSKVIQ